MQSCLLGVSFFRQRSSVARVSYSRISYNCFVEGKFRNKQQQQQQQQQAFCSFHHQLVSSSSSPSSKFCQSPGGTIHDRDWGKISHRPFGNTSTTITNSTDHDNGAHDPNQEVVVRTPSAFAVVRHGAAYEKAMEGYHGQNLEKAKLEGEGRDDDPFNPFLEDELTEELLLAEQMKEAAGQEEEGEKGGNELNEGLDDEDETEGDTGGDTENDGEMTHLEMYNRDGSIRRKESQRRILSAGFPSGGLFAVIEMAGTQFKVCEDDLLIVNRLKPVRLWSVGSVHTLTGEEILLLGSSHYSLIGLPRVPGAEVDVMVEEITKGEKVIIFKKRRRKNSQRKNGFRRDVTMLRVLDIRPPPDFQEEHFRARVEPEYKPLPPLEQDDDDDDDDDLDGYDDDMEEEEEEPETRKVAAA